MSPVCKLADNRRLNVDQNVKVVLFYAETKSVVATQRRFRAQFGTRWAPCKQTIYRLSLGTIFQPMRINSVPDDKCFCKNKNVLCVHSMVRLFVCLYQSGFLRQIPLPTAVLGEFSYVQKGIGLTSCTNTLILSKSYLHCSTCLFI